MESNITSACFLNQPTDNTVQQPWFSAQHQGLAGGLVETKFKCSPMVKNDCVGGASHPKTPNEHPCSSIKLADDTSRFCPA